MKKFLWFIFAVGATLIGAFFSFMILGVAVILFLLFCIWWQFKLRKIKKTIQENQNVFFETQSVFKENENENSVIIEGEFKRED